MDCSSTNASGDAETVAATTDGFGSTGNAIRKLPPSLDGSPKTIAFSVKMTSSSFPVGSTLNSNDWRSDVILCTPLMNSARTMLSASMIWCGVPGLRVVTLSRPLSSGSLVWFASAKWSTGGKIGTNSPCAGDNDVKTFGKLVSTNSLVSAGDSEFDAVSMGIADDKAKMAATSGYSYKLEKKIIEKGYWFVLVEKFSSTIYQIEFCREWDGHRAYSISVIRMIWEMVIIVVVWTWMLNR